MTTEVRPLAASEHAAAARVLAGAFQDDPMMVHFAPDPARRRRMLPVYFTAVLRQAGPTGLLDAVVDGGEVRAVSITMPPGTYPLPLLPQLREWRAIVAAGPRATLRNFRDLPPIDALRPREPYQYLMYVGTSPAARGAGHGRALLELFTQRADAAGLPGYLVTMNDDNPAWYARFGFAERTRTRMGRHGPPAYCLGRPAP